MHDIVNTHPLLVLLQVPVVKEAFGKLMDEDTDSSADEQAEKAGIWDANIQGRAGRGKVSRFTSI